jgi:integrase
VRAEMVDAGRDASTVNHVRRVIRGAFGTHASSPALAWPWMSSKVESEGQRMMGHRHITTTERYLHYAPDPDAAAKLSRCGRATARRTTS